MKFNSMRSLQCPNAIPAFVPGKFAPKHGRVEALLAFRMNQAYNKPLTANIWGMSWKTFLGTRFCRMFAWSKKKIGGWNPLLYHHPPRTVFDERDSQLEQNKRYRMERCMQ